jgi:hypothetical protein
MGACWQYHHFQTNTHTSTTIPGNCNKNSRSNRDGRPRRVCDGCVCSTMLDVCVCMCHAGSSRTDTSSEHVFLGEEGCFTSQATDNISVLIAQ